MPPASWLGCGPAAQLPVASCKVQAPRVLLLAVAALAGASRLVGVRCSVEEGVGGETVQQRAGRWLEVSEKQEP